MTDPAQATKDLNPAKWISRLIEVNEKSSFEPWQKEIIHNRFVDLANALDALESGAFS